MNLTIVTPTYNRANLLYRLYDSLKRQTNPDFEWLIVDDGSTDNTKHVIEQLVLEKKVKIKYIYQENSGKAKAFNIGVRNAKGELFLCVDSDDFLADDAINNILLCGDNLHNDSVAGIIALKKDTKGAMLSNNLPVELKYESTFKLSEFYKCGGEWSLIYKTEVLRKYLFPEIRDEKFITECVVYDKIAQKYKMFLLNEVITICEYQQDGLTNNIVANMLKNPTGYKIFYSQRIDMAYTFKKRLGYIIRYNAFRCLSKDKKYDYAGKYITIVNLFRFVGIIGQAYYKMKDKKSRK